MQSKGNKVRLLLKLPNVEWDFDDCPDDQLYKCRNYEYARSTAWICKHYADLSAVRPEVGGSYWVAFDMDQTFKHLTKESKVGFTLWLPPGFPDTPFLMLDSNLRQDIVPTFTISDDDLNKNPNAISSSIRLLKDDDKIRHFEGMLITKYILEIWWDYPDEEIVSDFRLLLKILRNGHKPQERRGQSPFKTFRRDLRALGAYRLLKARTAKLAEAYSTRGDKRPLFSTEANWSKAKKLAESILKREFLC